MRIGARSETHQQSERLGLLCETLIEFGPFKWGQNTGWMGVYSGSSKSTLLTNL
jgi:hypothetical protein